MKTNFKETYQTCEEFNFDKQVTAEQCWNTAYMLGRSRWWWGPRWWVAFQGWINTKLSKLKIKSCPDPL